ncbi:MAG: hypothetical protein RI925_664 [Pseudomonadota bacterium]
MLAQAQQHTTQDTLINSKNRLSKEKFFKIKLLNSNLRGNDDFFSVSLKCQSEFTPPTPS